MIVQHIQDIDAGKAATGMTGIRPHDILKYLFSVIDRSCFQFVLIHKSDL
jgi:hypothetical protein